MSTRAIAPIVGVSHMSVANDLANCKEVDSRPITGVNGKTYIRPVPVAAACTYAQAAESIGKPRTDDRLPGQLLQA